MALVPINLATLGNLNNGVAGLLIDKEIQRAIDDLEDRWEDDRKARKVNICLELTMHESLAVAQVHVEAKLPPRKSGATVAQIKAGEGGKFNAMFQAQNATRPDQPTFPALDEDGGEVPNE